MIAGLAIGLLGTAFAQGAIAAVAPNGAIYAKLRGSNEVGGGDPDGYGSFTAVPARGPSRFCYAYAVNKLADVTSAHIHRGAPGVNGPVVMGLYKANRSTGATSGCVAVADSLFLEIRANPGSFHVNIRTGVHPAGAIRGQLFGG